MRTILVIILLLSFPLLVSSQSKPDLSGTWVLDESKSKIGPGLQDELALTTFTIVHHEPEIKLIGKLNLGGVEQEKESVYFSDARGETIIVRGENIKSVTKWNGNKLVMKYTIPFSYPWPGGGTGKGKVKVTEVWELSKDGQKLTRTLSRNVSAEMPMSDGMPARTPEFRDVKIVFKRG